jgi:CRISPR-associated endonuclease/helicase Cas3
MTLYFAHSNPTASDVLKRLHPLEEHLRDVARLAASFACDIAPNWAELAGRWHDLGKYRGDFQCLRLGLNGAEAHIESSSAGARVTHSTAGALHAIKFLENGFGKILAYLIAGHHAGLPDWAPTENAPACLSVRLQSDEARREYREAISAVIPDDILHAMPLAPPTAALDRQAFALWLRMLFSCLVDADFLDTEDFFNPEKRAMRGNFPHLQNLQDALRSHLLHTCANAAPTPVNALRAGVLATARDAAASSPGFFTLTVPTGGGKTLSSLAFALDHAIAHGKRRVIYAIPYTSIIEQTAKVFRDVFAALGENTVLEHHSNLDVAENKEDHASRLAAENWDAPLIVTTNVQLFESMHASRTSRCRKLHNLIGSVIILDEAQLLPSEFLSPIVRALKNLVTHFGVTVVLCTATQPALATRKAYLTNKTLLDGIDGAHEIVGKRLQVAALFQALQRVEIRGLDQLSNIQTWDEIAGQIAAHRCALAIVNTRRDALNLHGLLSDLVGIDKCVHLSALMCAEHRSAVITDICRRLASGEALIVISTQLVEAGVDLDFPVVFRALAGLDSIAQAAGRCNREGKLPGKGVVFVFNPGGKLPGTLGLSINGTLEVIQAMPLDDPLAPATFERYFNAYYARADLDKHSINALLTPDAELGVAFRTAAERFKLIDEDGESIVVPYRADGANESPIVMCLAALAKDANTGWARRKLQRFSVNVPRPQFERMLAHGDVQERCGLFVALKERYDPLIGLRLENDHGPIQGYFG